jgi:3D-(3,5/4)-trihydroxycyclohexane-1,2-dione acylhydrolase (decyclizing)
MPRLKTMTLVDAVAAFLAENGIRYLFGIGGHGNTPLLEALKPYHRKGTLRVVDVQHEAVAAHAAMALRWAHGIESAVFTSIGPGWFNTLIGQATAMSDGHGYLIFAGDKTTAYEGPNMQQIMRDGQFGFVKAASAVSKQAYTIIDPRNVYTVLPEALAKTREKGSAGPVNVFLPMNLQSARHEYNLGMLSRPVEPVAGGVRPDREQVRKAVKEIHQHQRIAMRVGGGAVGAGKAVKVLAEALGAAVIMGPVAMDVVESDFPLNVGPAGSKGSVSGNYAAEHATLVINVGGRGVCQSDCSATLYARAKALININLNAVEAQRYDGLAVVGDAKAALEDIHTALRRGDSPAPNEKWIASLQRAKRKWERYLNAFYEHPIIDGTLTQPAVVKAADNHANEHGAIKIFDAGDVQAHGFQICRHFEPKTFLNETGNSCMGFGISAAFGLGLVPDGRYPVAIIGDGSFLMQAQAIRDMVKHGSNCTVVVLDNQAMGAITALQWAQEFADFATLDSRSATPVDFAMLARSMGCAAFTPEASIDSLSESLEKAYRHPGPAVVDVKVHLGPEEYAALGAFGRWNVGPWSPAVETIWEGKAKP